MDENQTNVFGQPVPQHSPNAAYNQAAEPKTPKIDHLVEIAQLAGTLHNVSPSGAESVRDQILMHVGALQDPKAYDERMAREKKANDELEAANAKDRAKNKAKVA
jgi:hypothetical protein